MKVLDINRLNVSYAKKRVLQDVCFSMNKGEIVSVVGKSGTGKSTLLNAIAGLVEYDGDLKVYGSLGMIFQNYSLYPWFTAEQNVLLGLDKTQKEDKGYLDNLFEIFEIDEIKRQYPYQLSGGQKQRVAILRAFAQDPNLILMDEPYSALDYVNRKNMEEWLSAIVARTRKSVLFVTHELEFAIKMSDRILVISKGRLIKDIVNYNKHSEGTDSYKKLLKELVEEIKN